MNVLCKLLRSVNCLFGPHHLNKYHAYEYSQMNLTISKVLAHLQNETSTVVHSLESGQQFDYLLKCPRLKLITI